MQLEGMGALGASRLRGSRRCGQAGASTPVVVFAHIPLWTAYPEWGWGTQDSAQALDILSALAR